MGMKIARLQFALLAGLPMGLAALGALLDERRSLGLTLWRSACRASGFSLRSLAIFTLELLPLAVIGALLGGLIVIAGGVAGRARDAHGALAAHLGCAAAMPLGLLLCASALPAVATLVMEVTIAGMATLLALRLLRAHQ
jgi:hypothetical protein